MNLISLFSAITLFLLVNFSSGQAINEDSPYALHPSRNYRPPERRRERPHNWQQRRAHHRRNHREHQSLKLQDSRTAFNTDYNLQRDYIATTLGKEIQLDCKIRHLATDDGKIVWLKMPKGEILTLNGNRVTQEERISAVCNQNQVPCWSLAIKNVRETDTGFYVCQTNSMQTKYVYLDVMVPPKLLTNYPVDRIDVNQSMKATVECEFYGKPEPLVKWFKYVNGSQREIEMYRGHKTIELFVEANTPSELECVADNSIPPTVSKKIYLNIQQPPQAQFMNNKVYQALGETVIFDCDVKSNPVANIYWFKNNSRIYESKKYRFEVLENNFYRLFVHNLTADDFGNYYLRAVNMLGKASASAVLMELPKEDIVVHRQTTNKPVSVNIDKVKLFDLDKAQVNKTDIILSKILNVKQQQKGVKEEDLDSDEYDDLDDSFYSSNKPFYFTKSDSANRTLYRNNPRIHLKSQSDYSQQDEDNTSTLKYHILQIGSSSLQIRSHLELTGFFLFASVSSLFQSNLL